MAARTCTAEGCDNKLHSATLCHNHYRKLRRRKRIYQPIECGRCSRAFTPRNARVKYCDECGHQTCPQCGVTFVVDGSRATRKFCTVRCKQKAGGQYYYSQHKDEIKKELRNTRLQQLYGISLVQYEEIFSRQLGVCAICQKEEVTKGKLLNVDHDHETGKIRQLLCTRCNCGLGSFLDDPRLLREAAEYLEKHKENANG